MTHFEKRTFFFQRELRRPILTHFEKKKKKKTSERVYYSTASMNYWIFKSIVCDLQSLNLYNLTNPDKNDANGIALFISS
jgi:hypothetical protein